MTIPARPISVRTLLEQKLLRATYKCHEKVVETDFRPHLVKRCFFDHLLGNQSEKQRVFIIAPCWIRTHDL